MDFPNEKKELVRHFSDKSRRTVKSGNSYLVPHKFSPEGEVLDDKNFRINRDLSKLNLNDLRFLKLWQSHGWDEVKTLEKCNLHPDQAKKTFKKLAYFKVEDARVRALAEQATPEMVLAKDVENIETGKLSDSQHKSLDRVAKIVGAFKTTEVNIQQNIFQMPPLPPQQAEELRRVFDSIADVQEAEVA